MLINGGDRIIRSYKIDWTDEQPDIDEAARFYNAIEKKSWTRCHFSADGEYVIGSYAGEKHDLVLWHNTGELVKTLVGPIEGVHTFAWHPTRPVCASLSEFGQVFLWRHTPQQKFSAYEPSFTEVLGGLI